MAGLQPLIVRGDVWTSVLSLGWEGGVRVDLGRTRPQCMACTIHFVQHQYNHHKTPEYLLVRFQLSAPGDLGFVPAVLL